jgi:hopene-associated glycosyltransferase HpnB
MNLGHLFGFIPLLIWLYLLLFHRGFWRLRERDTLAVPMPERWPSVVAVVPARNEADVIQHSIGSLVAQDYPGEFHIVLVDDQSDDGTADLAKALNSPRLTVLTGAERPAGWTGKLWAMHQGSELAAKRAPEFLWFTDADIAHSSENLRYLVARAQDGNKVLVSLMARLSCKTAAEHFLIPAFVFFFDMLFPFGAVNDPKSKVAAAAGGCMLARRTALENADGIKAIRHNIIDDCALGRAMKRQGPIWLGLTDRALSLRPYEHLADIRHMVSRSAYAQLNYSPLLLVGTLLGLGLVYIAPVMIALFGTGHSQMTGYMAWAIMAIMFQPILRFYRQSPLWGLALPLIGAFYAAFTLESAIQYWSGKGGMWKGRAQAGVDKPGAGKEGAA